MYLERLIRLLIFAIVVYLSLCISDGNIVIGSILIIIVFIIADTYFPRVDYE